jgi:hypothetical protein
MKRLLRATLVALLLAGTAGLFAGCGTTGTGPDPKPWVLPAPWDDSGPFPSGMNHGR